MYKLYASCLKLFIQVYCESNEIVTDKQAGRKKGFRGCAEQLLMNKTILKEVKKQRRNFITVWLDYAKTFDSVSHSWLFAAFRLVKVPEKSVVSIDSNIIYSIHSDVQIKRSKMIEIVECVRKYLDGSSQNLQSLSSY